jgi:hypothetical protein
MKVNKLQHPGTRPPLYGLRFKQASAEYSFWAVSIEVAECPFQKLY